MFDIIVKVYKPYNDNVLLAMIPLDDNELIATAMVLLHRQGRFSAEEIEAFRYHVDRNQRPIPSPLDV